MSNENRWRPYFLLLQKNHQSQKMSTKIVQKQPTLIQMKKHKKRMKILRQKIALLQTKKQHQNSCHGQQLVQTPRH